MLLLHFAVLDPLGVFGELEAIFFSSSMNPFLCNFAEPDFD